ncbi:hypothetical protein [Streptomyces natalensis]|uniref:Uncharacterized protein n=1 Tax=Streptomyces natalensis ATCC 27448 TaxID=1240678 RepID=A0A0D7CB86_9ACTN|nr:hypothetical protein [Streptomyces natalensis]KIZ13539.1 hypothetical protein SNA_39600 [Streptomyces natalensis ATCC 27448]
MSASMSFHGDPSTWVHFHDYGTDRPPILALDGDGYHLTISVFESRSPADHKEFAEKLAQTVTGYLAAVDRWAAAQVADTATTQDG